MNELEMNEKLPFTLIYASVTEGLTSEMDGYYDENTQTWKGEDMNMSRTRCRTSSTGFMNLDDDNAEKDD